MGGGRGLDRGLNGTGTAVDPSQTPGDSYKLAKLAGSPELQARLNALLSEYKHVFSEELRPEPAKLNPMNIGIDISKWENIEA